MYLRTIWSIAAAAVVVVAVAAGQTGQTDRRWTHEPCQKSEEARMATTRWTGATSGDWATAGNWSNGVPGDGDTVIIPRTSSQSITTNLDRTGDVAGAGLNLALLHIEEGYHGNVGSSGNPLMLTADKIKVRHDGELWFESKSGTAANVTDLVVLDGDGDYDIDCLSSGIVRLDVLRGNWNLNHQYDDGAEHDIYVVSGSGTITIDNSTFYLWQIGGEITSTHESGASLHHYLNHGTFVLASGGANAIFLYQFGGSWYYDSTSSFAPEFRIFGGLFDATRTTASKAAAIFLYSPNAEVTLDDDFNFLTNKTLIGE